MAQGPGEAPKPDVVEVRDVTWLTPLVAGTAYAALGLGLVAVLGRLTAPWVAFAWPLVIVVVALARPPVTLRVDGTCVTATSYRRVIQVPIGEIVAVERVWTPFVGTSVRIVGEHAAIELASDERTSQPFRQALGAALKAIESPVLDRAAAREILCVDP